MADDGTPPAQPSQAGMFAGPPRERTYPTTAIAIAAVAIAILFGLLLLLGRRHGSDISPATPQAAAAYASSLAVSNIQMSESSSLSGGKLTYIDGHIANHGTATVSAITAQALFPIDQSTPQVMTVPLNLVRTREPYVDVEPVSAAPLAPGGEADFRLIFEGINENWTQQQPEILLVQVSTK